MKTDLKNPQTNQQTSVIIPQLYESFASAALLPNIADNLFM